MRGAAGTRGTEGPPRSVLDDRAPRTLVDKIWDLHVVASLGGGLDLVHVDRHWLHDLSGPFSLTALARRGLGVRNPELCFATPDHAVSTQPGRSDHSSESGARLVPALRSACRESGIRLFDLHAPEQGIVHVVAPELGLTLPGTTIACGDSHTCTHGGLGALGWGIGSNEVVHLAATQTLIEARPRTLRVCFEGRPATGVEPKDWILHLIGRIGADAGSGCAVEYAGEAVGALSIEGRMTLCNLSIELGARMGLVAPDDTTYDYLEGRPFAPHGRRFEQALAHWRTLPSDEGARFDREIQVDAAALAPQVTWGTSPAHTIAVDAAVPDPATAPNASARRAWEEALVYMDLRPGQRLEGLPVQRVFVGSCANSRLSDLEAAARIARGRRVAEGVRAWVVPGSRGVKRAAEARGLDQVFREAGFEWREPGCSLCVGTNGELVAPGERCVSTSNRNFKGRQGPASRTHLTGAAMAAAAAVCGAITDVRRLAAA